jgi:hypothetical protein
MRWLAILAALAHCAQAHAGSDMNVLTYHNDDGRSGLYPNETILKINNVKAASFGKLLSYPVDGEIYAQPLYVQNVDVGGKGPHNVVYVATQHNSVYAFDADACPGDQAQPLWHVRLLDAAGRARPVPEADVKSADISPEIGITATPVIDATSGTIYVVSKTKEGWLTYAQRLHALDIATGVEKFGGPVEINATVDGSGSGSGLFGRIGFAPRTQLNRPGLALANGVVYSLYGSHGDRGKYHGWVLGHAARSLRPVQVFNTTPNGEDGGIWMSGAAPAIDRDGSLYFSTGDGSFEARKPFSNFGNSFLKLFPRDGALTLADYFTPHDYAALNEHDLDVGGGGVVLLPDAMGSRAHPHLMVGCGKGGKLYVLDRDRLGQFNPADDSQVVQTLNGTTRACFSMPAVFAGKIYMHAGGDTLKALAVSDGRISETPVSETSKRAGYPGATPSISSNRGTDGIVWIVDAEAFRQRGPAVLRAYDANDLSRELYNSSESGVRDRAGPAVKFTLPTIANGRVYVGTSTELTLYGLLPEATSAQRMRDGRCTAIRN